MVVSWFDCFCSIPLPLSAHCLLFFFYVGTLATSKACGACKQVYIMPWVLHAVWSTGRSFFVVVFCCSSHSVCASLHFLGKALSCPPLHLSQCWVDCFRAKAAHVNQAHKVAWSCWHTAPHAQPPSMQCPEDGRTSLACSLAWWGAGVHLGAFRPS